MKTKRTAAAIIAALMSACFMVTSFAGCTNEEPSKTNSEPAEAESVVGREDGERFKDVIVLEGMEETVCYEHVRNETLGFELDYDYEKLERRREENYEQFVSRFDDPEKPQNYLEVSFCEGDVKSITAAFTAILTKQYGKVETEEQYNLDRAGSCIQISASQAKKNKAPKDSLQTVYLIPASGGCLVATSYFTVESAEGFGARFTNIIHTISILDRQS